MLQEEDMMRKKLSKIALLAATTAFLLAGFPACSDDDDEEPTLKDIEIDVSEAVSTYTVGDPISYDGITVTATYSNNEKKDVTKDAKIVAKIGDLEITTLEKPEKCQVTFSATYEEKTAYKTHEITVNVKNGNGDTPGTGNGESGNGDTPGAGNEDENLSASKGVITLYKNGASQGEKTSVSDALKAISTSGSDVWEIRLTPGTYTETEQLTYNGSATVKIIGATEKLYGSDVIIKGVGSDYTQESERSMFEIYGSGNTVLKNVRMEHSDMMAVVNKEKTQREVIGHQSKGMLAAYNCSFISRQDTIRTQSKAWFYKCYIEGDVDFLWIESNATSKVALYEDCELYAVGDRKNKAYFTAPRLPVNDAVGKGVVIWKSKLKADDRLSEVYLGRNPWDKETDEQKGTNYFNDYYENVAVVDSDWSGKALDSKVWSGSGAHGTDNQQFVGFKTCQKFPAPSPNNCNAAVLTAEQVAAEYSDRNYILNRVYNINNETFENDPTIAI